VPADTILIESDSVANAILELTSVLNIPKLIVGISKSKLRYTITSSLPLPPTPREREESFGRSRSND